MTGHKNLGRVLRYGESSAWAQEKYVRVERDRIARIIRKARVRAKANRAANNGIYRAD